MLGKIPKACPVCGGPVCTEIMQNIKCDNSNHFEVHVSPNIHPVVDHWIVLYSFEEKEYKISSENNIFYTSSNLPETRIMILGDVYYDSLIKLYQFYPYTDHFMEDIQALLKRCLKLKVFA